MEIIGDSIQPPTLGSIENGDRVAKRIKLKQIYLRMSKAYAYLQNHIY